MYQTVAGITATATTVQIHPTVLYNQGPSQSSAQVTTLFGSASASWMVQPISMSLSLSSSSSLFSFALNVTLPMHSQQNVVDVAVLNIPVSSLVIRESRDRTHVVWQDNKFVAGDHGVVAGEMDTSGEFVRFQVLSGSFAFVTSSAMWWVWKDVHVGSVCGERWYFSKIQH